MSSALLRKNAQKCGFRLAECIYDERTQQAIIDQLIGVGVSDPTFDEQEFGYLVCEIGSFFKQKSFSEEKEWRLVSTRAITIRNAATAFRAGRSMIVPYYKFPLGSRLDSVIVGPCPHTMAAESAVSMMFFKYGLTRRSRSVRLSSVPFRNW
jgi:hypothetical protein